jgi:uncharacterized phiE125 gp8 family phage protein
VTVQPATEPVTIHEAKRACNLAVTDTAHDVKLALHIQSAREQFEHDTSIYLIKRTVTLVIDVLEDFQFPHKPINSITSVTYYDVGNVSRTLSSSLYQLDAPNGRFRLATDQTFPSTYSRWDAVTFTYLLGNNTDSTSVESWIKRAILLLVTNEFEQVDMMSPEYTQRQIAYERLITRFMRSTYP